jgi:hypothetical protein
MLTRDGAERIVRQGDLVICERLTDGYRHAHGHGPIAARPMRVGLFVMDLGLPV